MNRKILLIAIFYVIGTIWGLYFSKNIISIFYLILVIYLLISNKKALKFIACITFIISSTISLNKIAYINKFYNCEDEYTIIGNVISVNKDDYYSKVLVEVKKINKSTVKGKFKCYVYIKKDKSTINEGDCLQIYGSFSEISEERNYGGFNYKKYLQSKQIFGLIKTENFILLDDKQVGLYERIIINTRKCIKEQLYKYLLQENAELCIALILGDKENVSDKIIQDFSDSGLSHILAISGMHVAYVALLAIFLSKILLGKSKSNYAVIIALIFFCNLANNSESVFRATIMLSLYYIAKLLHRKSDSITNLAISTIINLVINPFCIYNTSFVMSSLGALGIICFYEYIDKSKIKNKILSYIKKQISLGLSANLTLMPVVMLYFNKLSFIFFISSPFINVVVSAIMPVLILFIICNLLPEVIKEIVCVILSRIIIFFTNLLIYLASLFSKFNVLNFTITTPSIYRNYCILHSFVIVIYKI